MNSLNQKITKKKFIPVKYTTSNANKYSHVLLEAAAKVSQSNNPDNKDIEFCKLAVSSHVNLMNPQFKTHLESIFSPQQIDTIKLQSNLKKSKFQEIRIFDQIDNLFDSLKTFQFE